MPGPIALLFAGLLACGTAFSQSEIRVLERREIAMPAASSHRLAITLVQLEDSGWTRERSVRAFAQAMAILQQCDLGVARAEWLNLSTPSRYLDFSTPASRELARVAPETGSRNPGSSPCPVAAPEACGGGWALRGVQAAS